METVNIFFILTFSVAGCVSQSSTPRTCTYLSHVHEQGDSWVDDKACDTCTCNEYGVQCQAGLNGGPCPFNSSVANPGDPACVYGMQRHVVGNVFNALDGCNTCLCTERGMQCTAKTCAVNGFAQPSMEPLYGECLYKGGWYLHGTQWQAGDGCNTCYCYTVGNYRGGHVCTSSSCPCQDHAILTG